MAWLRSCWPQTIAARKIKKLTFNSHLTNLLLLSAETWCSLNVQTAAAPISNIYFLVCWKFLPLSKQMLLTSYHFCSSTEPSGTQVERDNPLYESQVLRPHTIVQVIISTSPVQHPSVMQSMCYIAVPFLPISAYLFLPHPSFTSFLHSPYPLSSLPFSGTDHWNVPRWWWWTYH